MKAAVSLPKMGFSLAQSERGEFVLRCAKYHSISGSAVRRSSTPLPVTIAFPSCPRNGHPRASRCGEGVSVGSEGARRHAPLSGVSLSPCPCCAKRKLIALDAPLPSRNGSIVSLAAKDSSLAEALVEERAARPQWIDGFYTWLMHALGDFYESKAGGYKEDLFGAQLKSVSMVPTAGGKPFEIMELGIGPGPNLKFYGNENIHVVGVDPSRAAKEFAEKAASDAGLKSGQFEFVEAFGEGLPLEDSSVDAVISSLVLCSVSDLLQTVSEVHRVLRPGGTYFFMEHVADKEGTSLRKWQTMFDPVQQAVFDGCHLIRDPVPALKEVGFEVEAKHVLVEGLGPLFLCSPHLIGKGIKSCS